MILRRLRPNQPPPKRRSLWIFQAPQIHSRFQTAISFLTDFAQSDISFAGFGPGYSAIQFGGQFEIVPVPEPSSVATAMVLLGLIGWRERRKERQARRAERSPRR